MENLGSKIGLICCKWFSYNAPGTKKPQLPILSLFLSGVIRISPQYESEKFGKFGKQNWLYRLQMVQL